MLPCVIVISQELLTRVEIPFVFPHTQETTLFIGAPVYKCHHLLRMPFRSAYRADVRDDILITNGGHYGFERSPMTGKPITLTKTGAKTGGKLRQFPDFPPREDMHNWLYLYRRSFPAALAGYLGVSPDTIAGSEIPLAPDLGNRADHRIPDLMVSYNSDPDLLIEQNGYEIDSQGKPPDFVLEVASPTTGVNDYTAKRRDYERYGVVEYWRFDPSGGEYHDEALAGDRLVDGVYVPVEIERVDDERRRGYSEALGLYLCWEYEELLWFDPAAGSYLLTYEEITARAEREAARAEREAARAEREAARASEEAEARRAETRRAELAEAELQRLRERLRQMDDI